MLQRKLSRVRTLGCASLLVTLMLTSGCTRKSDSSPDTSPASTTASQSPSSETASEEPNSDAKAASATAEPQGSEVSQLPVTSANESPSAESATDTPPPVQPAEHSPSEKAGKESAGKESARKNREREELFKGWPDPKFALVVTGQQMGYIEPCGCTGLANQKGGLARRHTLVKQLAERGWPVFPVDVGNQVRRFGRQSEIKFQLTAEALKKIGYRSIAFGVDDLRLSVGELASVTLSPDEGDNPFVSANAAVLDRALIPTHHIVDVGGKKLGITSILGTEHQTKIIGGDIQLTTPEAGLESVVTEMKNAKCDVLVLLAHTSLEESANLARKYPDFHVVVTAGGLGEPTFQPEPIEGTNSIMVQVGLKGMFVGVLGYFDDPKTPWRYQRVPLDDRFSDSPEMLALMAAYQEQLKTLGLENLGLKPLPHSSGFEYTGSEKCGECHTKAYAVWEGTPHAHATESLVHPPERAEIARHFDPECLSCHVTGWNPQRYYPYSTGYLSLDETPLLKGSGCENCHGPGSAHVAAESGEGNPTPERLAQLRASMRLRLSNAQAKCIECHDIDNSPDFHETGAFERYWKQVEHKGLD